MFSIKGISITAIIVHYKTYDLTKKAIWSLHSLYENLEIIVLDNFSDDGSNEKLLKLTDEIPKLKLVSSSRNIHHGPGMDKLINENVNSEWFLTFDSDCIAFRKNFIELMIEQIGENTYGVGEKLYLDSDGFMSVDKTNSYEYIHPYCALFNKKKYLQLPPFEKHGSPCLTNEIEASKKGYALKDFPACDYVYHQWRGTAGTHGYKLGIKSKMQFVKWKTKKLLNIK